MTAQRKSAFKTVAPRAAGLEVRLLQASLSQLGFDIPAAEQDAGHFGRGTVAAVRDFQKQQGLPASAVVDAGTGQRLAAAVQAVLSRGPRLTVRGTVRSAVGKPAARVLLQAFDRTLRDERLLGAAITSPAGRYTIAYSPEWLLPGTRPQANLVIRATGLDGVTTQSATLFAAPAAATVDLVLSVAPPRSEYERLTAAVEAALDGVPLAEASDADLAFLAAETRIERAQLDLLRAADRVAREGGLPRPLTYALARHGVAADAERFFAADPAEVRSMLEGAVKGGILPTALQPSLDALVAQFRARQVDRLPRLLARLQPRAIAGRLLDEETGAPLAGYRVQVADTEQVAAGGELVDARGTFALAALTRPETGPDGHILPVRVLDRQGREVKRLDFALPADDEHVLEVRLPGPALPSDAGPTVAEVAKAAGVDLPAALVTFLEAHDIKTLADVRAQGGLHRLVGLPVPADHAALRALEAQAQLSALATDVTTRTLLAARGFATPGALARVSRADIAAATGQELGEFKTAQLHATALAQGRLLDTVAAGLQAENASRLLVAAGLSDTLRQRVIGDLVSAPCGCQDCQSALSPGAYLADLLEYVLTHVKDGAQPLTLAFLEQTFHLRLSDLPLACRAIEESVRQVRLCIEVLRARLIAVGTALPPARRQELERGVREYRLSAYTSLLEQVGVSYAELRLARTADAAARAALAARLGLDTPDRLGELLLEPDAITESALERLFGLVDTTRNPLVTPSVPTLRRWRLDRLRALWREEDASVTPPPPPAIDPDLIGPADLADARNGNAAFDLWKARRAQLAGSLSRFRAALVGANPAGATSGPGAVAALDGLLAEVVGVPAADLVQLAQDRGRGAAVTNQLATLGFTSESFDFVMRARALAASGSPVLDSEWEDVSSILVAVEKRHAAARWRAEEAARDVTLGPDFFVIPPPSEELPPPAPVPLPAWRATLQGRRDWQERLKARIDQEQGVVAALASAVDAAEEACLPGLRDTLVLGLGEGPDLAARAKALTDRLLVDAAAGGCAQTTRVAQALEALQGLLFGLRTGQLADTYPRLRLDADDFDDEWQWIGSYATWRSALATFLYPETVLLPSLRTLQTPGFRRLVAELRGIQRITAQSACEAAARYSAYFTDVCNLRIGAVCVARTREMEGQACGRRAAGYAVLAHLFASAGSGNAYWSAVDVQDESEYAQSFWTPVPGLTNVLDVVGAAPYRRAPDQRYVYVFARVQSGGEKLVFTRLDLERQAWDGQPLELELPEKATQFTAVVKQSIAETEPPHLVIRVSATGTLYERRLNADGTDWADLPEDERQMRQDEKDDGSSAGEWLPLVGHHLSDGIAELCALVQVAPDEHYLLAEAPGGDIRYRLFGPRDDGRWRDLYGSGFRGAFAWPGTTDCFVFYGYGAATAYRVLKRSAATLNVDPLGVGPVNTLAQLEAWLQDVAGVSLADVPLPREAPGRGTLLRFFQTEYSRNRYVRDEDFRKRVIEYSRVVEDDLVQEDSRAGREWKSAVALVQRFFVSAYQGVSPSLSGAILDVVAGVPHSQPVVRDASDEIVPAPDRVPVAGSPEALYRIAAGRPGPAGLRRIAPRSTWAPSVPGRAPFAYQRDAGHVGLFRSPLLRSGDDLAEQAPVSIAPRTSGPYGYATPLESSKLQALRALIREAFAANEGGPLSDRAYLEEAHYFVPVHVALQLQARGEFTAALDWLRLVYDYRAPAAERRISYWLELENSPSVLYTRPDGWLRDPLNPHAIAATRARTYARFTLLALVRCFLDFADAEFALDTAESLPRARTLYLTALDLLREPDLHQGRPLCEDVIGSLEIALPDEAWQATLPGLRKDLRRIGSAALLQRTVEAIGLAFASAVDPEAQFARAQDAVRAALAATEQTPTLGAHLAQRTQHAERMHQALLAEGLVLSAVQKVGASVAADYSRAVSLVTGMTPEALESGRLALPWLGQDASPPAATVADLATVPGLRDSFRDLGLLDPLSPPHAGRIALAAARQPLLATAIARKRRGGYMPRLPFRFCIPPNPELEVLRLRADLNLYNLRSCRDRAGQERPVDPYAAPTDIASSLPRVGGDGRIVVPQPTALPPTAYRYQTLIDRAKQLAQLAGQIEAALLAALEKRDAEGYTLRRARNDAALAQATVRLQDLKVREAEEGVKLAQLQEARAQLQVDHFAALLAGDVSELEQNQLDLLATASTLSLAAAQLAAIPNIIAGLASGSIVDFSGTVSNVAQATSTQATIAGLRASYERRAAQWAYEQSLAQQDTRLGAQQVENALARVRVSGQELAVSQLQADNTAAAVDYLANKFTGADLYDWMQDVLGRVYRYFLEQATVTARLAAAQLAFERQEAPPAIQPDYWDAPIAGGGQAPDRAGLTGSARLLQDIFQLDQYAFTTNARKLQLTRTLSLAQLAPAEFQRFRETGVLIVPTPMELFDRDFPGHYLRLVRRVRVSVIALVPPSQGIRATLSTRATSRVVVRGPVFQMLVLNRPAQTVALSSPRDASGVFELDPQSDLLLPFEGIGVETTWELRLPRPANLFDYDTIADVLLTLEYTALHDAAYGRQVIASLAPTLSADRAFSFRQQFQDQWFDLHNPDQTATPLRVRVRTRREDFPSNLEHLAIAQVVLYFARAQGAAFEVDVAELRFTAEGSGTTAGGPAVSLDGVISTRRGNAAAWTPLIGQPPVGEWELALADGADLRARFAQGDIMDILLVVTFNARTPEWPA